MTYRPTGLMAGLLAHPEKVALATGRPRFTWVVPLTMPGDRQAACQIRIYAGDDPSPLRDSGRMASDVSVGVPLPGTEPLAAGREYAWQVRTWNWDGVPSDWSERQRFRIAAAPEENADGTRHTVARYPLEKTAVTPSRVTPLGSGAVLLDFGRAAFAGLTLTLSGPPQGGTVTVHLGEALGADGRVNRQPGGSVRYHRADLALQPGVHEYVVPLTEADARRMPPTIGPVMPFRYAEVEGLHAPLAAHDAYQTAAHYPFDDGAARFTSSDPALNEVWELCRYTMKATSFCGLYVDGDRERLPYEADAYINQLGHYACDREFTLARYTHEYLIQRPTWPTEWFLQSVLIAWNDCLYSGDPDSLAAFYDDLTAKTLEALARPDGLISTVEPTVPEAVQASVHHLPRVRKIEDIVDWPPGERDGYEMRPVNTVVNAFHYAALEHMARIAAALDRVADANTYRAKAARVRDAVNEALFDPAAGLYVDGEGSAHHSLHANLFPLALGVVPEERITRVARFVAGKGMACSVYGAQFLLDALYEAGEADAALSLLTATGDRGWLHMRRTVGSTMTLEAWDAKYKPNLDWNHAWGAAPANIIPRRLMGIEPRAPGFHRLRIRPQPGSLRHADLLLPTVRGTMRVAFDNAPDRFMLEVTLPANTVAEVHLPVGGASAASAITVDGARHPAHKEGDFLVCAEPIGGGGHRIELRR